MSRPPVAIVGAGIIGRSWAAAFAGAGHPVRLYDSVVGVAKAALPETHRLLRTLAGRENEHGPTPSTGAGRIDVVSTLAGAVDGAAYVQENTPERLDVKRRVFKDLDSFAPPEAVLASSTSALLPSEFTAGLPSAHRCLVAHPLNPPHLIPAVEIVPSEATSGEAVDLTRRLLTGIGQKPFLVNREVAGFVMNRLQGALLDEAFALVAEGYATVEAVDTAVRDGLARRWSIMGPFETIDLNAPGGIAGFIERYGPAYAEIGRDRPARYPWTGALRETVTAARRSELPAERLAERGAWRDERLAALAAHFAERDGEV